MKINKKYVETFIFLLVYLFGIFFWSQPYQERKIPYGEFDAISHFEVADYVAYNDKSFMKLPDYIDIRYGNDNRFKQHILWYPPTFHASLGAMEAIGGERVLPVYLLNTIMATFIIITIYFVMNSLFGFLPAILSSLLIIFSPRDFMPYLWGQWPERFAYALVPIILYCFYKYFIAYSKEDKKPLYLYLTSLFLGINLLIHPLIFFHSVVSLAILYIFLAIKQRKLVFNIKHIAVAALIFLIMFFIFPYQTFNIFPRFDGGTGTAEQKSPDLSRLFHWSLDTKDYEGSVPANYFSFKDMHGSWTLPFLLLGILFLALRRKEQDIFMLAWLVALYLILHRDLIGKATFLHRSLSQSAHIFAPLTAIGAVYLVSLLKVPQSFNKYIKYAIIIVLVYFTLSINMANAYQTLNKNTYNPNPVDGKIGYDFLKILTEPQFEAAEWVLKNVPEGYNISILGIPHQDQFVSATAYKIRWFAAVSQHVTRFYYLAADKQNHIKNFYILLDYTMLGVVGDKITFDDMQQFEKTKLANHTLVYNKNNIKIYRP